MALKFMLSFALTMMLFLSEIDGRKIGDHSINTLGGQYVIFIIGFYVSALFWIWSIA